MRIVGIDPGSRHVGWGIIAVKGSALTHVASGTLDARAEALPKRLHELMGRLKSALTVHAPTCAAMETMFYAKNARSAFILAQARGALLLTLAGLGLDVHEYSPSQVKQAATGRGQSDKAEVQRMVRRLLGLDDETMATDTSDALACALCHANALPFSVRNLRS